MTGDAAARSAVAAPPRGARLRLGLAALVLVLAFLVLAPVQWLANRGAPGLARRIPVLFHRLALRLLGVRLRVVGRPAPGRPLLLAANHVSWLDISLLGAAAPVAFVSKGEVAGWPVFGTLARLQRTVFVDRARRAATGRAAGAIAARLRGGEAMVLFPEGTTGDGTRVQPFRSALLAAAGAGGGEGAQGGALVQPVGIAYLASRGLPLGRLGRLEAAWIGDADLVPHLLATAAMAPLDVEVRFGEPRPAGPGTGRKELARLLEADVRALLASAFADPRRGA